MTDLLAMGPSWTVRGTGLQRYRPPADHTSEVVVFTRIDHVGVAVRDLDEAIAFYQSTFGMRCVHVETNAQMGVREAMLAVGTGDSQVQLLAPLSPQSTIARFLDRSGPGIQQVAYTVADVAASSAELRAKGLRLLYDEPRRGTAGTLVNFVHPKDAGGVLVELVEHRDQAGEQPAEQPAREPR
jgi:methylmalonyl-CoA/ethylmalonyl-CoA epimerase